MIAVSLVKSLDHDLSGHPEGPHRFHSIKDQINEHLSEQIQWIEPTPIQVEILEMVHSAPYIRFIREQADGGPGFIDYGDTYVTQNSFHDALNAAAGTLSALDHIIAGKSKKGFALVRPPGHHASTQKAMGFCLFNNIAIAARKAQAMGLQRVAIVDFDVHHGNGTQEIFNSDPDVLYISTHQWGIFPGTGAANEIGEGEGQGLTLNIPLPPGVGDAGFEHIYSILIIPALHQFKPELILISAGYDAHFDDPLANLQLSSSGYHKITRILTDAADDLAEGRMLMVLEGGYNPQALAQSVVYSGYALAGLDLPDPGDSNKSIRPETDIQKLLEELRKIHHL